MPVPGRDLDRSRHPGVGEGRATWLVPFGPVVDDQSPGGSDDSSLTTAGYVRSLRVSAGLSIGQVARKAGVEEDWLKRFEDGSVDEGPNYDLLLKLIAATQPPRPEWWDSGHEHDLQLPPSAIRDKDKHPEYWERIEQVRDANRRVVRS